MRKYRLSVRDINLNFTQEHFVVFIRADWGSVRLSYELVGVPALGSDGFSMDIYQARLGHFPLPGPAKEWMAGRLAPSFSEWKESALCWMGLVGTN